MRNNIKYLTEEISKQSVKGLAWLLLNVYSKIGKNRNNLKTELLIKSEAELKTLETLSLYHTAQNILKK